MAKDEHPDEASEWHLKLFRKSLLKQDKLRHLLAYLGPVKEQRALDVGGDNGVIPYFLRKEGGTWMSDEAYIDGKIICGQTWLSHPDFYRLIFENLPT